MPRRACCRRGSGQCSGMTKRLIVRPKPRPRAVRRCPRFQTWCRRRRTLKLRPRGTWIPLPWPQVSGEWRLWPESPRSAAARAWPERPAESSRGRSGHRQWFLSSTTISRHCQNPRETLLGTRPCLCSFVGSGSAHQCLTTASRRGKCCTTPSEAVSAMRTLRTTNSLHCTACRCSSRTGADCNSATAIGKRSTTGAATAVRRVSDRFTAWSPSA
mmetsp:Transcript_17303/g.50462  ORF Transcript_17303/g.50462 Transcript_17303/m.50462 type:complete len:215 (-) Transcript_17303:1208-1852(-)